MSKNFTLRRLPGKVVQQQTPSPKSRNFGQSYQRSDGYSYTFKQIPTRLTVYRRDASTLRPLTDRRKPAVQHLHILRYAIISCSQTLDNRTQCACAEFARYVYVIDYDVNIARELCACVLCPIIHTNIIANAVLLVFFCQLVAEGLKHPCDTRSAL